MGLNWPRYAGWAGLGRGEGARHDGSSRDNVCAQGEGMPSQSPTHPKEIAAPGGVNQMASSPSPDGETGSYYPLFVRAFVVHFGNRFVVRPVGGRDERLSRSKLPSGAFAWRPSAPP